MVSFEEPKRVLVNIQTTKLQSNKLSVISFKASPISDR